MQIAQRSTEETGLGAASGYFTLDRYDMTINATSAGRYTMTQSTITDLEGFSTGVKFQCTTPDTSIAAGELLIFQQHIEGFNAQQLKATSTSTRAFTVSFYAKSNANRAIASEVTFSNGTNRQMSKLHTIGTSWARYTMTVPAASSTQIDNDNSNELQINFWLHAGSTYTSGTLNDDALDSVTNANRAAGIGSIFASTDNTLEITGLQVEVGSVATPFEHRSFGEELQLCQRYYQEITGSIDNSALGDADQTLFPCLAYNTTLGLGTVTFTTPMRGLAAIGYSAVGHFLKVTAGRGDNVTGLALYDATTNATTRTAYINVTSGNSTAGGGLVAAQNTAARLNFDAEL